jgi:hypothetical protein
MSAGAFKLSKYEANDGKTFAIKIQPETEALSLNAAINVSGVGSVDDGLPSAIATGSRRKIGVHARTVSFKFTSAPASGGYLVGDSLTLPVLTKAKWDAYVKGSTGTYLGAAILRTGKADEKIN